MEMKLHFPAYQGENPWLHPMASCLPSKLLCQKVVRSDICLPSILSTSQSAQSLHFWSRNHMLQTTSAGPQTL